MRKHRLSTTISRKHFDILDRNVEQYGSQQKVLEAALELLEDGGKFYKLNEVQRKRVDLLDVPGAIILNRRSVKHTIEGKWDKIAGERMYEFGILVLSGKSVDNMDFQGLINIFHKLLRVLNLFEKITLESKGGVYNMKILHNEGKTYSEHFAYLNEEFFKEMGIDCKTTTADSYILHTLECEGGLAGSVGHVKEPLPGDLSKPL